MKPSPFARLLALVLVLVPLGCPVYADLYEPNQGAGTTTGAGGTGTSGTGGAGGVCVPASIAPCYDGPPGTEGHGLCQAGSKTCNADGTAYGLCSGEVTPTPEDCATPVDEDCDGLAPACKGTPLWSERAGDSTAQYGTGVAVDGAGNVLVTGYFSGTMDLGDLGGCPLSNTMGLGLFVAKLDPSGKCLWSKSAGDGVNQSGASVAADSAGNVLVSGSFSDAMNLGGCLLSNAGGNELFIAKLDPSGNCLWSKTAGDAVSEVELGSVAADSGGNVLVSGSFSGAINLGVCSLSSTLGFGLFVAKLDPSGKCLWGKSAGDTGNEYGKGVAVDSMDNVLVTGSFSGAMDLGGCPVSNAGGSEFFIAKLDLSGKCLWSRVAGSTTKVPPGVAADGANNVLVTGSFSGAMDLGGCPPLKAGVIDPFVAKLDPSGKCMWRVGVGAAGDPQYGGAIAADSVGNVLLAGSFSGAVDFGGGSFVSAGGEDIFLVKLDAAGEHLWSRRAGSPLNDAANDVAVDSAGNVLVTGYFKGAADFGTGPLVSEGGTDVFVAKFAP